MDVNLHPNPMRNLDVVSQSLAVVRVRVWDIPTRLFHWSIVCLIAFSWYTADRGLMQWHLWSGSILLALILFRIVWGFVGSTTARFGDFLRAPSAVVGYFKAMMSGNRQHHAGHNPAGGWMVALFMAILLSQAVTGMLGNDGVKFQGPLALWVSSDFSDRMTELHGLQFNVILLLIWAHLVAVFFYWFVQGENLVKPMVTGYKHSDCLPSGSDLKFAPWSLALGLLATSAALVGWIVFA